MGEIEPPISKNPKSAGFAASEKEKVRRDDDPDSKRRAKHLALRAKFQERLKNEAKGTQTLTSAAQKATARAERLLKEAQDLLE